MRGGTQNQLAILTAWAVAVAVPARAAAGADLELVPDGELLLVHLAVLLALIYPIQRLLLNPLVRVLEERERRTEGATAEAVELEAQAVGMQGELEERLHRARANAQARRNSLMADAAREEGRLLEQARHEGSRMLEAVRDAVADELGTARRTLEADARALAREAAAKLLGRAL